MAREMRGAGKEGGRGGELASQYGLSVLPWYQW